MAFGPEIYNVKRAPIFGARHLRPENLSPLKRELGRQLVTLKSVNANGYSYHSKGKKLGR